MLLFLHLFGSEMMFVTFSKFQAQIMIIIYFLVSSDANIKWKDFSFIHATLTYTCT